MKLSGSIYRTLRSAMAVILTLWCAGAGCLLVSYAQAAGGDEVKASGVAQLSASVEGMAGAGHACCKARHTAKQELAAAQHHNAQSEDGVALSEAPAPANSMSCCPLTSGSFLTSAASRNSDDAAVAVTATDSRLTAKGNLPASSSAPHPIFKDQSQTHVRYCVFLI